MDFRAAYRELRAQHKDAPAKFEEVVRELYTALLRPGDVAVDCGAHTGKHTLPMAQCVAPDGTIFAFEPIAEKLAQLEAKAAASGLSNVINARNCLVGDQKARMPFNYVQGDPGKSSIHLRQDIIDDPTRMATNSQRVLDMVRLDDCLPGHRACRFIKIDVEGAEVLVLRGARQTVERHKPVVHFEMGTVALKEFGSTPAEIWAFFAGYGYGFADILGNPLPSESAFLQSEAASGVYDYVALPLGSDMSLVANCARRVFGT